MTVRSFFCNLAMIERSQKPPAFDPGLPRLGFALFCLFFFGIPLWFYWYSSSMMLQEEERQGVIKARSRLEFAAMKLGTLTQNKEYFTQILRSIIARQIAKNHDWAWLSNELKEFKRSFPGLARFVGFNNHGVHPGFSGSRFPQELLKDFARDCAAAWQGSNSALKEHLPVYRQLLGPMAGKARLIDIMDRLDFSSGHAEQRYVYVSPVLPSGFLVAFFHESPNWDALNFRRQIPEKLRSHPTVRYRLCRIDRPERILVDRLGDLSASLDKALMTLGRSDRLKVEIGRTSWMRVRVGSQHQVILASSVSKTIQRSLEVRRARLANCCLTVFFALSLLAWLLSRRFPFLVTSVRWQSVLLLLFVVIVSLGLLQISARGYLLEKKKNLVRQTFADLKEILTELDNGFPEFQRSLKIRLEEQLRFESTDESSIAREASSRVASMAREMGVGTYELFDSHGKLCFDTQNAPPGASMQNQTLKKIFRMSHTSFSRVIRYLNGDREEPVSQGKAQVLDMTGDLFGIDADLIISQSLRNIGGVSSFDFGNSNMKAAFVPVRDGKNKVRFLAYFGWNAHRLHFWYLRSRIATRPRLENGIQLMVYHFDRNFRIPSKSPYSLLFNDTSLFLFTRGEALRAHLRPNQNGTLLVGCAARFLPNFILFALIPDNLVKDECSDINYRFLFIGLGILLLSLIAGNELARSFWEPIADLQKGMSAIDERRFDERIPVRSSDEFGHLAIRFNELIESLTDLEIAETLQKTLFPQSKLVLSDWEIYGHVVPTSKVGGDFYDYFSLPDHRIGFVVGDVSGHGAGAALVVGMAKAFFAHPDRVFEPASCLKTLSELLLSTLKQKKMMTCLVGIFDPLTRRLLIANAGQTYPLVISPTGVEFIKIPGFPLGFKNKRGYLVHEQILRPDQVLLLYTDYLVEAESRPNVQLGFPDLEAALPGLVSKRASETEQAIREWHQAQVIPGPAQDDLTIVVLQQRANGLTDLEPERRS